MPGRIFLWLKRNNGVRGVFLIEVWFWTCYFELNYQISLFNVVYDPAPMDWTRSRGNV
ncbi:MAG: hypothetical protein LLF83_07670 [Methanobacterium sp.]|nr:hypothetical protein [Methanobacterium sp.]